ASTSVTAQTQVEGLCFPSSSDSLTLRVFRLAGTAANGPSRMAGCIFFPIWQSLEPILPFPLCWRTSSCDARMCRFAHLLAVCGIHSELRNWPCDRSYHLLAPVVSTFGSGEIHDRCRVVGNRRGAGSLGTQGALAAGTRQTQSATW